MTDREQIETTYKKIRAKHPDITDKDEINRLAIKLDKQGIFLRSLGWFLGAIACSILIFLRTGSQTFESIRYLYLITAGSCIFECFRTLGKYSKVEQKYRPTLNVKNEGILTKDIILRDGENVLKKAGFAFHLVKLPLCDKEDESEVSFDNAIYHKYHLQFRRPDNNVTIRYEVKRDRYMDAVIGTEYFVAVTPAYEIAAVYQATNWSVDPGLQAYFVTPAEPAILRDPEAKLTNTPPINPVYQPNPIRTNAEPAKTQKLLPILSMVLIALSYFTPIIIGVPMSIAALVLAVVGLVKQRSTLSIVVTVINAVLFLLLIVSVIAALAGLV